MTISSLSDYVTRYEQVLQFYYGVLSSIRGKVEPDERILAMEHLATKVFLHAATINYLHSGTTIQLTANSHKVTIKDFASALVLTRAVFDTYLNLFEVFFEPDNDDEFEYRRAVYEVNGFKSIEKTAEDELRLGKLSVKEADFRRASLAKLQRLREQIARTQTYQRLKPGEQKSSLDGKINPGRKPAQRVKAAGFDPEFIAKVYTYLSGYTHGDALSGAQIHGTVDEDHKELFFELTIPLVMMVIASIVTHYEMIFPEVRDLCSQAPQDSALIAELMQELNSIT